MKIIQDIQSTLGYVISYSGQITSIFQDLCYALPFLTMPLYIHFCLEDLSLHNIDVTCLSYAESYFVL